MNTGENTAGLRDYHVCVCVCVCVCMHVCMYVLYRSVSMSRVRRIGFLLEDMKCLLGKCPMKTLPT